jgi:hypothetical protein
MNDNFEHICRIYFNFLFKIYVIKFYYGLTTEYLYF